MVGPPLLTFVTDPVIQHKQTAFVMANDGFGGIEVLLMVTPGTVETVSARLLSVFRLILHPWFVA